MTQLKELLSISHIPDLDILTKDCTVTDKTVASIDMTETPDVAQYISDHCLILTTGMIYQDNQQGLIPLIDSLIAANASGLAIKTGRFLNGEIQPDVITYANQMNFPLINIPDKYPLGPLLHQLTNYMQDRRQKELEFALEIQSNLSSLVLNNISIEQTINELAKAIQCPIILLDPFKDPMAYSGFFLNHTDLLTKIAEAVKYRFQQEKIPNDYITLDLDQNGPFNLSVSQLHVLNHFPHYLLVMNPESMTYPTSRFAIDQAALVLSYILFKEENIDQLYQHTLSQYLLDDLADKPNQSSNLLDLKVHLKLQHSNYYHAIAIHDIAALKPAYNPLKLREKHILITRWLNQYVSQYFNSPLVIFQENQTSPILILQEKRTNLEKILKQLQQQLTESIDIKLIFSIGQVVKKPEDIPLSISEAEIAFDRRLEQNNNNDFVYYDESEISRLFQKIDYEEIHYFCKNVLKELAYPKSDNHKELRKTLAVYLDSQCETTTTAKTLYIHRNTVKYRIEKCEDIFGKDIREPKTSLELRLALTLSENQHN